MIAAGLFQEAARLTCLNLKEGDFVATVHAGDLTWDVYTYRFQPEVIAKLPHPDRFMETTGGAVTIALRTIGTGPEAYVDVGAFLPGAVPAEEVTRLLVRSEAAR